MAFYSRFFGSATPGLPAYTQPQFAEVFKRILSDGVFTGILNTLTVVETDPVSLAVRINSGEGWVQGFWCQNTSYETHSLAAADPTNPRIDRIVLRLDTVTNFKISIEVLTGTPAGSPVAPTLTQTASTYEISLAKVSVLANATSVNNAKITDERTYVIEQNAKALGGWIPTGTFTYLSPTTITVAYGAVNIYQKGDKIKYTQVTDNAVRNMYIVDVTMTVLTVKGDVSYYSGAVLNEAITLPYYSHQENPLGFVHWKAVTPPVWAVATYDNGSGGQPTTNECRYKISGNQCTIHYQGTGVKASNDNQILMTSYSFIAPLNTTVHTSIGTIMLYVSSAVIGIVTNNFSCYFVSAIADNATIAHFGFTVTYEI